MANGDGAPSLFTKDNTTGEYSEYTPPSFKDTLPEDVRSSEHLNEVGDGAQLAKSYIDLIAKQPVLPSDASGYSYEFPENFSPDEKTFESFKARAHELGITQKTFSDLMAFEVERDQAARQAIDADIDKNHDESVNALKTEWGDKYDQQVELAKRVVRAYDNPDFNKFTEDSRFGDNPHVLKLLAWVGSKLSEDAFIKPGSGEHDEERRRAEGGGPMLKFPSMEKK